MTEHSSEQLSEKIKKCIQEIPDFPKPGISFKDITPILADAGLSSEILDEMLSWASELKPDYIAGMESRGFIFGFALAQKLGIGFIPIRKPGKLPRAVHSKNYDLEYGEATLQIHKGDIKPGGRVLVHDDLLATGGTADAAVELIKEAGGELAGLHFLVELEFLKGREKLPAGIPTISLVKY